MGETGRPLDLVARYDPATDTWETLHRLPDPLRAAAAAAVDGILYVIGGTTEDGNTADVNAYDPETDTWTPRAPLPEPRFNHSALELGGKIYVLGGYLEGQERRDVFVYDPAADSWSEGPELPDSQPRLRRGCRGRRDLDDRRAQRRRDPPRRLDPRMSRPGAGGRAPRCPSRWSSWAPRSRATRFTPIWESTYQVYDTTTGRVDERPALPRHPPRAADLLHRRRALHGRRLHDAGSSTARSSSAASSTRANFRRQRASKHAVAVRGDFRAAVGLETQRRAEVRRKTWLLLVASLVAVLALGAAGCGGDDDDDDAAGGDTGAATDGGAAGGRTGHDDRVGGRSSVTRPGHRRGHDVARTSSGPCSTRSSSSTRTRSRPSRLSQSRGTSRVRSSPSIFARTGRGPTATR